MPGMNPNALRLLMQAAEQGNPAAQQALKNEGKTTFDQTITPPPTDAQINVSPQAPPPMAQPMGSPIATELPPPPATMPSTPRDAMVPSATPPQQIQPQSPMVSSALPQEKGPWSPLKQGLVQAGVGLLGAGVAKAFGGGDAAGQFMTGYAAPTVEGMQEKQRMENTRSQKVWADQWEQVQSLPAEVMQDPKFQELRDAAMAMSQDMQKGNVANPKTAANFMMARAKFKDELDNLQQKLQVDRDIEKANLLMDAQHQNNQKRLAGALATVQDPNATREMRLAAEAFLKHEGAAQPREVQDPYTGQTTTKMLTDEEYNKWGFELQQLKMRKQELDQRAQSEKNDQTYRQGVLANDQERARLEGRRLDIAEGRVNSQRGAEQALGEFESAVKNSLSVNDPNAEGVPAAQRESMAIQKVLGDSNMQRTLTTAAGVKFVQGPNGQTGIRIGGRVIPFDRNNPRANIEAMQAVYGLLRSNRRLGAGEY